MADPIIPNVQLYRQDLNDADQQYIAEHQARQTYIRNILRRYCCIYISKLPSWTNFWDEISQEYPALKREFFAESFQESLACFDDLRRRLDNEQDFVLSSFQDTKEAVATEVTKLHDAIVGEESIRLDASFAHYFPTMVQSQIEEFFCLIPERHYHNLGIIAGSKNYPARTFLALASLGWSFSKLNSSIYSANTPKAEVSSRSFPELSAASSLSYLGFEVIRRHDLIRFYEAALKISSKNEKSIENIFEQILIHRYIATTKEGVVRSFCIARRWRELKTVAGEAIIVCGSPFFDESIPYDIPKIVETGNDEDFESLRKAILGGCRWIKDICARLRSVPPVFLAYPAQCKIPVDIYDKVQGISRHVLGEYDPSSIVASELRQLGLGLPARRVLDQISNHGSTEIDFSTLVHCLTFIRSLLLRSTPRSEADFISTAQTLLRVLRHSRTAKGARTELYSRHILQSILTPSQRRQVDLSRPLSPST